LLTRKNAAAQAAFLFSALGLPHIVNDKAKYGNSNLSWIIATRYKNKIKTNKINN